METHYVLWKSNYKRDSIRFGSDLDSEIPIRSEDKFINQEMALCNQSTDSFHLFGKQIVQNHSLKQLKLIFFKLTTYISSMMISFTIYFSSTTHY
jgi:hypothetical protein